MIRRVGLPPVIRLRALARILRVTPEKLANSLPGVFKSGGKVQCTFGEEPFLFSNVARVVVPFSEARDIVLAHQRRHVVGTFKQRQRHDEKSQRNKALASGVGGGPTNRSDNDFGGVVGDGSAGTPPTNAAAMATPTDADALLSAAGGGVFLDDVEVALRRRLRGDDERLQERRQGAGEAASTAKEPLARSADDGGVDGVGGVGSGLDGGGGERGARRATEERQGSAEKTPVVVLLGHFDHGKTTLLDALGGRLLQNTNLMHDNNTASASIPGSSSSVVGGSGGVEGPQPVGPTVEAGGITQEVRTRRVNLGRWSLPSSLSSSSSSSPPFVPSPNALSSSSSFKSSSRMATFVDTPGQAIFYRLRSNGALAADVALLVVDVEEGVGPQTEEAIGCAEELGVPVVVAINKVDRLLFQHYRSLQLQLRDNSDDGGDSEGDDDDGGDKEVPGPVLWERLQEALLHEDKEGGDGAPTQASPPSSSLERQAARMAKMDIDELRKALRKFVVLDQRHRDGESSSSSDQGHEGGHEGGREKSGHERGAPMVAVSAYRSWGLNQLTQAIGQQLARATAQQEQRCRDGVDDDDDDDDDHGGGDRMDDEDGGDRREPLFSPSPSSVVAARGVVLDLGLRKGEGAYFHVLMEEGRLEAGNEFVAGLTRGRVRAIRLHPDDDLVPGHKGSGEAAANKAPWWKKAQEQRQKRKREKKQQKKKVKNTALQPEVDGVASFTRSSNGMMALGAGEAGIVVVTLLAPPNSSSSPSSSGGKSKTSNKKGGGGKKSGGGGVSSVKLPPVGEPFLVLSQDVAPSASQSSFLATAAFVQDARHVLLELGRAAETAKAQGLVSSAALDDDEDDEDDDFDDDDDAEVEWLGGGDDEEDAVRYPQRPVVIKAGTAAAAATILDAIDELRMANSSATETEGGEDGDDESVDEDDDGDGDDGDVSSDAGVDEIDVALRMRAVEVVMVAVGPVTPSDLAVASMAGASKVHFFAMNGQGSFASASAHSARLVQAKAAELGLGLVSFDTIQGLLDDVIYDGEPPPLPIPQRSLTGCSVNDFRDRQIRG